MKKTFLNFAMMAIAVMAMSVTMVSCGDDDVNDPINEVDKNMKPHTYILASLQSNLYQYIDLTFKMDGKDLTMNVTAIKDTCNFKYTEDKLNEGAKIEVTVALKPGVNVDDIPDEYNYGVATEYVTGTFDDKSASNIVISSSYIGGSGTFTRLIEKNKLGMTTKQEVVDYVIKTIGDRLSGSVKSK